jgi:hypothetical protein
MFALRLRADSNPAHSSPQWQRYAACVNSDQASRAAARGFEIVDWMDCGQLPQLRESAAIGRNRCGSVMVAALTDKQGLRFS